MSVGTWKTRGRSDIRIVRGSPTAYIRNTDIGPKHTSALPLSMCDTPEHTPPRRRLRNPQLADFVWVASRLYPGNWDGSTSLYAGVIRPLVYSILLIYFRARKDFTGDGEILEAYRTGNFTPYSNSHKEKLSSFASGKTSALAPSSGHFSR